MKKLFPTLLIIIFLIPAIHTSCQVVTNDVKVDSLFKINDNCNLGDFIPSHDDCGIRMCNIGDLDGDGIDDLAVGADEDADGGGSFSGAVYIIFMNKNGTAKSYQKISSTQGNLGISLTSGYRFGSSVCVVGDIDGDGIQDLAVGCCGANGFEGSVIILFMNKNGTVKKTHTIDGSGDLSGLLNSGDVLGVDVNGIGDLNGDGVPDLIAGADHANTGSTTNTGEVFVLFLNSNGTVKSHQLITNSSANMPSVLSSNEDFGNSVKNIGDIDGDGINDISVGAYGDDGNTGAVFILRMNKNGTVKRYSKISNQSPAFLNELQANNGFGETTERVMDLNGDGIKDLIVGSSNDGGSGRGALYIFYLDTGANPISFQKLNSTTQTIINDSITNGEEFGVSVADINSSNTNFLTLAVGIPGDPAGGTAGGIMIFTVTPKPPPPPPPTTNIVALDSIGLTTDTLCVDLSPVYVRIKNLADSTIDTFPLIIILSGDTQVTFNETVYQSIASGQTYLYNLVSALPNLKNKTINKITIVINVPGNTKSKDDTIQAKIQYIPLSVGFSAPDVCIGDSTKFKNLSKGPINHYIWSFGDGDSSTLVNPAHLFSRTGSHQVILSISGTCGRGIFIVQSVNVDTLPSAAFTIKGACTADTVYFKDTAANKSQPSLTYKWYFGDGDTSNAVAPIHFYAFPGIYTVSLKVKSKVGCSDSVAHIDTIYALPVAQFISLNDSTLQASNGSRYQWYKNGSQIAGAINSALIIDTGGKYEVEITNGKGCSSFSPAQELRGPSPTLYIPNAFTPGKKGLNDTFRAKGASVDNFLMQIYNRWGEMVFQSDDMNKGWDGTYQGVNAPVGYYFYMVQYWGYETKVMVQNGLFWLIR